MKAICVLLPSYNIDTPPLALQYLQAILTDIGIENICLDINILTHGISNKKLNWNQGLTHLWKDKNFIDNFMIENEKIIIEELSKSIEVFNPDFLMISLYETNSGIAERLIRYFESLSIKVYIGGPEVNINPNSMNVFENKNNIVLVRGLGGFFNSIGLDVERDRVSRYVNGDLIIKPKGFSEDSYKYQDRCYVRTSVGCPNNCTYCEEKIDFPVFKSFSIESILKQIEHHLLYGRYKKILLPDAASNGSMPFFINLAEELKRNFKNVEWYPNCLIREEMNLDMFKFLKDRGCARVQFGLETFSKEVLEYNGKTLSRNVNIERMMEESHKANMPCSYNIMFGLPGETKKNFDENMNGLIKMSKYMYRVSPSMNCCDFYERTYLKSYKKLNLYVPTKIINGVKTTDYSLWRDSESSPEKRYTRLLNYLTLIKSLNRPEAPKVNIDYVKKKIIKLYSLNK